MQCNLGLGYEAAVASVGLSLHLPLIIYKETGCFLKTLIGDSTPFSVIPPRLFKVILSRHDFGFML